jgi:uroporphyrinogen III methyltransferase/synthase
MATKKKTVGSVAVVGVGPGDPGLVTLRAVELLGAADLVVGAPEQLALVREHIAPGAEVAADGAAEAVRAGRTVVVVVAGDPLSSRAGVAETTALAKALARSRVVAEIVPGVAAATAVPAYAGVPLAPPFTVAELGADPDAQDWAALAAAPGTLVLGVDAGDVGKVAVALTEHGRAGDTPVAVTLSGATGDQRTVVASLDGAEEALVRATGPAVMTVGPAVRQRDLLSWWESRALFGWTVLVPRTRAQAGELTGLLRSYGARPLEVPTIAVEPPRTPQPMERAVRGLVSGRYAWVAFTSVNAVRAVREKLEEFGLDARSLAGVKVAAVGSATAASLAAFGLRCDLVPSGEQSSEGLLVDWPDYDELLDMLDRVFLPRADIATETLVAGLKERGWAVDDITAYRTVRAAPPPAPVRESIKGGGVDAVLFTSSSTVRNLVGIAGKPHESTVIACIGPQTAATARELGLSVDVLASSPSVETLVADLAAFVTARREQDGQPGPVTPDRARRR